PGAVFDGQTEIDWTNLKLEPVVKQLKRFVRDQIASSLAASSGEPQPSTSRPGLMRVRVPRRLTGVWRKCPANSLKLKMPVRRRPKAGRRPERMVGQSTSRYFDLGAVYYIGDHQQIDLRRVIVEDDDGVLRTLLKQAVVTSSRDLFELVRKLQSDGKVCLSTPGDSSSIPSEAGKEVADEGVKSEEEE